MQAPVPWRRVGELETERRDIPVELDAGYFDAVKVLRAYVARFMLVHWHEVDGARMLDLSGVEVEPRLKQMIRPLSLVLQLFPDGEERILSYLKERQIEIRRERAASFDGLCFNLAVKLADGAEDLRDDPKFSKYYRRDGTLQAVEPRMIAALLGTKTPAVSRALRRIGFKTTDTKITYLEPVSDGKDEKGRDRQKFIDRKKTILKATVPDEATWKEMVHRYHFVEPRDPGDGQQAIADEENPGCPPILQGPLYTAESVCTSGGGTSGTSGTDQTGGATSTAGTVGTAPGGTHEPPRDPDRYVSVQANPNPCGKCGRTPSHYVASSSGSPMIDMTDPTNHYLCKACHDRHSMSPETDSNEVSA